MMRALMLFQSGKEKDKVYGNIAHTELDSSIIPIRFTVKIFLDSSECRCSNIFVAIHNPCGQRGGMVGVGVGVESIFRYESQVYFLSKSLKNMQIFQNLRGYICVSVYVRERS